jgi:hypothetical protein
LVLSHFDTRVGPEVFLHVPELNSQVFLDHIPLLMDFYEKGFFIHEFGEIKSSNLIFRVPSPVARGNTEVLMISIIFKDEECEDPKIFQGLLEQFVRELRQIEDVYQGFYRGEKGFEESYQVYTEIRDLLNTVYQSLPKETIFMKARDINLVLFDFFIEGKSQLAKLLGKFISTGQYYKDISDDSIFLYSKISISEYSISISNQLHFNKFLELQLKNQDGFIFVVDVTNKILFKIAELTLDLIFNSSELKFIPSLILIAKKETDRLEIHKLLKNLRVNGDADKIIKYIPIDASDDDEIRKAINLIVERITIKRAQVAF